MGKKIKNNFEMSAEIQGILIIERIRVILFKI